MTSKIKKTLSTVIAGGSLLAAAGYFVVHSARVEMSPPPDGKIFPAHGPFFTDHFPANASFMQELYRLRATRKLTTQNEVLIQRSVASSTQALAMPPAVLWCLLFQESRLNHLDGIDGNKAARGIGQFNYFSFDEVNNNLGRYTPAGLGLLVKTFGHDIRPIAPLDTQLTSPSSYYFIPTAVVSSAAFLNNRYLQLTRNLDAHAVAYDPELMWLHAAMAYNKGARSVFSLWNEVRAAGGNEGLQKITNERSAFFEAVASRKLIYRSLRRIWPAAAAEHYAQELSIHIENFKTCALKQTRDAQHIHPNSVRF